MNTDDWDSLLKLLGLIVMMDDKVYQEELEAFSAFTLKLQKEISPDIFLSETMTRDWFVNHRSYLKAIVEGLDYDQAILNILAPIRTLPQKDSVLQAMIAVAKADGFFHDKEKMIITKTARYWNVKL